jgi:hypothetical protein
VAIERDLGLQAGVNAYLSFSKGGAFKPHWDSHDVLILQIHGRKRWRIWDAEIQDPVETSDPRVNSQRPPALETEMLPGDVLFIPRGEPHSATVSAEHSVHLTFGFHSLTGLDFLDHLRKRAAEDPLFRMNLPRHSPEAETREHEARLKEHLHRLIDAGSTDHLLSQNDLCRCPIVQTAVSGILPDLDDELRLTLRRRVPLPEVMPDDEPQLATIGGHSYRLVPASIAILRWLFAHDPATRRELDSALSPLFGRSSVEAALIELLRLGFLSTSTIGNCTSPLESRRLANAG